MDKHSKACLSFLLPFCQTQTRSQPSRTKDLKKQTDGAKKLCRRLHLWPTRRNTEGFSVVLSQQNYNSLFFLSYTVFKNNDNHPPFSNSTFRFKASTDLYLQMGHFYPCGDVTARYVSADCARGAVGEKSQGQRGHLCSSFCVLVQHRQRPFTTLHLRHDFTGTHKMCPCNKEGQHILKHVGGILAVTPPKKKTRLYSFVSSIFFCCRF